MDTATTQTTPQTRKHICPRCGGPVYRVHRQPGDRLASAFADLRRYRCRADICGWEGLLERSSAKLWKKVALAPATWALAAALGIVLLLVIVPFD